MLIYFSNTMYGLGFSNLFTGQILHTYFLKTYFLKKTEVLKGVLNPNFRPFNFE